jgi:hypothetical protein
MTCHPRVPPFELTRDLVVTARCIRETARVVRCWQRSRPNPIHLAFPSTYKRDKFYIYNHVAVPFPQHRSSQRKGLPGYRAYSSRYVVRWLDVIGRSRIHDDLATFR